MAVVGLGQGGGNLAGELYRRGYCYYIGVEGYDGAGGDPGYGRECIRRYADALKRRIETLTENADVLLICAGLGGGTGSVVADLISTLATLDLPTLVLATLPAEHESAIAKVNSVRALNEAIAHNTLGLILIDNAGLAKKHGGVSSDRYYAEINRMIVEPLDALNRLNARMGLVPIRSFDGEDFRRLLLSSGLLSAARRALGRAACSLSMVRPLNGAA